MKSHPLSPICFFFLFLFLTSQRLNAQILLTANFEGGLPPGWTTTNSTPSVGWEWGDAATLSSEYFAIPPHTSFLASNDDAHDDATATLNLANQDYLITPSLDFSPYNTPLITFAAYFNGEYGSTASVIGSTNGGATWFLIEALTPDFDWQYVTINLSPLGGFSNVKVAFHHNDNSQWASGFAVDDVQISVPPAIDLAVQEITVPDIVAIGNHLITGTIVNNGGATVTSFDLNYSLNEGPALTDNLTGLSIPPSGTYDFTHSIPWLATAPDPGVLIEVWATNINGMDDMVPFNDLLSKTVSVAISLAEKNVLIEQFTGAWAGYSPDGDYVLSNVLSAHPNAIAVNIHNSDAMENTETGVLGAYYASGYPTGMIDRVEFDGEYAISRGIWEISTTERLMAAVPASVSLDGSFNSATRALQVTATANFIAPVSGDYRLNVYIVENHVVGSGSGYDQTNYYNATAGHPYFGAGDPIIGYAHNNVLRAALGGAWGQAGSIPAMVSAGASHSYNFNTIIPTDWDETNLEVIGILQKYGATGADREIINSNTCSRDPGCSIDFLDCAGNNIITGISSSPAPGGNSALLNWDDVPNALAYQIKGRKVGTMPFGSAVKSNSFANVGGLLSGTCYEWKVRAACTPSEIGPFSPLYAFCTPEPKLSTEEYSASLHPNPVTDQALLSYEGSEDGNIRLRITDLSGRLIRETEQSVRKGPNTLVLDFSDLINGSYLLQVDGRETLKFIVIH